MKKPQLTTAALMVAFLLPTAYAETTDQLVYDNPEYSIVLTVIPCKIDKKHHPFGKDFAYEATAFDKTSLGHACWFRDGEIVHVWFWEEQKIYVGSYKAYLFKPVKPTL
jgi:hypothetical protein